MNHSLVQQLLFRILNFGSPFFLWLDQTLFGSPDLIFCYHDVGDSPWIFSIPPAEFASQIAYLTQHHEIVSLSQMLYGKKKNNRARVAITFDDGLLGVYKYAQPILSSHGAAAAVFVIGDLRFSPHPEASRLLKANEIQELKDSGWEIGCHTYSHKDLNQLDRAALAREIGTGEPRRFFSYPFGRYSETAVHAVQRAGFRAAFTVDGDTYKAQNPYLISRVTVPMGLDLRGFAALTTTAGAKLNRFVTWAWQKKDQHV